MNPFHYGAVVSGADFYDRKDEADRIAETLLGGNNIVLYAPRRFGKTSLVFKIIEMLEKQKFICIYFDFMSIYSLESFVKLYSYALSKKQSNLKKFVQDLASSIKNIRPVLSFNASGEPEFGVNFAGPSDTIDEAMISQLLDMSEVLFDKKRVFIFFDEFQDCVKINDINFENLLRSKIQHHKYTNYLFFGSKTHILNDMFNNKKRAFYNSALPMSIGPLPEKETIAYLQKKFSAHSITINSGMAKYIITTAGDIPHYIQLLASEVWQYMVNEKNTVTTDIIDYCVQRVLASNKDYHIELFDRQSNSKKQLLQALSQSGKNIFSINYIKTYRLSSASAIQKAVKELIEDNIIEKINNEYFIADPFFKLFVINSYHPVTFN
ncbi:ATPase [Spirochaetia bacterium]|nr:ATPase [Spirochaetia bacterium]